MIMEKMPVTPQTFYCRFAELINSDIKYKKDYIFSTYINSTMWTTYLSEVVRTVLETFQLETQKEYFRIDYIGYRNKDQMPKGHTSNEFGLTESCWDLEVAVEYENDKHRWMDEFIKLSHIKCGLKILIVYSDSRDNDIEKLNFACAHMRELSYAKLDDKEQFLVIMGNAGDLARDAGDAINFVPYIYQGAHGFVRMLESVSS